MLRCPGSTVVPRCEMRVLITGATGFIGGRLCEVMALQAIGRPRAFVHSTATAARIARLPLEFALGDLCDRPAVERAMQNCDAVVHLARGEPRVMRQGLENVLRAAVNANVKRFVHMSSVAVHGNHPPPESASENAPVRRCDNEYGREKLRQEHLVSAYARRHRLEAVILRPPTVYGPFSSFTLGVLQRIRAGTVAMVNDGAGPFNLVYVDNVVRAILLALSTPRASGEIFFVTDGEAVTWRTCLEDHARWVQADLPYVAEKDLVHPRREHLLLDSLRLLPAVLVSAQFRSVMRQVPLARAVEKPLYRAFQSLHADVQQRIRLQFSGPNGISLNERSVRRFSAQDDFIAAQFRTVVHKSEKARRMLGYTAPVSYAEGMQLTEAWLRYARVI